MLWFLASRSESKPGIFSLAYLRVRINVILLDHYLPLT
jgi:hypothetical protein